MVDDAGEEEWVICNNRKLDDGGVEFLVKWKGGGETWESYENMVEAEELDKYERLHGSHVLSSFASQSRAKQISGLKVTTLFIVSTCVLGPFGRVQQTESWDRDLTNVCTPAHR